MRIVIYFTILCLLLTGCTGLKAESRLSDGPDLSSVRWEDDLSSDDVTCFIMDEEHRMWIGTSYGLNLYDGHSYIQFFYNEQDSTSLPNSHITTLYRDTQQRIWIGTENGVARYEGNYTFKTYQFSDQDVSHAVNQFCETTNGQLLITNASRIFSVDETEGIQEISQIPQSIYPIKIEAARNGGFWYITPKKGVLYNKDMQASDEFELPPSRGNMVAIYTDNNKLWAMQGRYLACIDLLTDKLVFLSKEELPILPSLVFCNNSKLFLKSDKHGLYTYDLGSESLHFLSDEKYPSIKNNKLISCYYKDYDGNMWLGFQGGGFQTIKQSESNYMLINKQSLFKEMQGHHIVALTSKGHEIWGSSESRLFYYNVTEDRLSVFSQDDLFTDTPFFRQTVAKIIPTDENIWIQTDVRLMKARMENGKLVIKESMELGRIRDICINHKDCYVTSALGNNRRQMLRLSPESQIDTIAIDNNLLANTKMCMIDNTRLLLCGKDLNMGILNTQTGEMEALTLSFLGNHDSKGVTPTCILPDGKQAWIGSKEKGLFRLDLVTNTIETVEDFIHTQIMSIIKDDNGMLWMGTRNGVAVYDNNQKKSLLKYGIFSKEGGYNNFSQECICKMGQTILIGSFMGCFAFPYADTFENVDIHFKIRDVFVHDKEKRSRVTDLSDKQHKFKYNENNLEIVFGNATYGNTNTFSYRYTIKGFDKGWNISPTQSNTAIYSNLPAGKYRFVVQAMQMPGNIVAGEDTMEIVIESAPWLSIPAKISYALIVIGLLLYINRLYIRMKKNKMRLEMAQKDIEREERTNLMNMNFFTNISHEFRNPLTMISGPISTLLKDDSIPHEAHRKLVAVGKSTNRMLRLIDQMLDFNQLENDTLKLKVEHVDVTDELNNMLRIFLESTKTRNIILQGEGLHGSCYTWLDCDKLDKIISNLFTNALKHTPDGGIIKLTFEQLPLETIQKRFSEKPENWKEYLCISIYNNGNRIDENRLEDVFKRYYQIKEPHGNHQYGWGTGIGLYYVRQLVTLHKGLIRVFNEEEGGVTFQFALPKGEEPYREVERTDKRQSPLLQLPEERIETGTESVRKNQEEVNKIAQKIRMLIIDDNVEIGQYLRSLFEEDYVIINKYSAESALESMEEISPDIILSDVVMNGISGYEFCKQMKSDIMYCHIPLILLTAKSGLEDSIEGLEYGANAYVSKPFDPRYLKAVAESQLQNIKNVHNQLSRATNTEMADGLTEQDKRFIDELYNLMEKHITEFDLNIKIVCDEMNMSRTKLNYKLKGLTGATPGSFFRKYKLNRAAALLREGKYNISEIALQTGFATVASFSNSFKKEFGVAPSNYK